MRVLVCGDRYWNNRDFLFDVLDRWHQREPITMIIEGGAQGADLMAREWALHKNIPFKEFPADWNKWGKAAGPIRNTQMLDQGKPQRVIGFHANIATSKGTKDMLRQSMKRKIRTWLFNGSEKLDEILPIRRQKPTLEAGG